MENIFYSYISELIKDHTNLHVEWRNNNKEIVFKKKDENGFDITIQDNETFIYIETEPGYHWHFDNKKDKKQTLSEVMGLVRDLLGPNMRIREILSNGKPRKWITECYINNKWISDGETGLLVWNYLGKKSEKIYQNKILEPRKFNV